MADLAHGLLYNNKLYYVIRRHLQTSPWKI